MGGNITVKSEVGQGSVFTFDIQVEPGDMSEIEIVQPTRRIIGLDSNQPTYRILVVEDHLENRLLLTQLLQTVGFDVREATNGQEAIELYESWQPHLIWMDMRMPVMDGYEATKRIRDVERQKAKDRRQKEDTLRPSPIIALTASAFEEDRERFLAAGCDDVVRKPLQEHEIFEIIHKYLEVQYIYEEEKPSTIDHRPSTRWRCRRLLLLCLTMSWRTWNMPH
jgi:CheY-like chemotaxis protein